MALPAPSCPPASPCPPGRPAPSPSQHGTRLLDLKLSGRHQQEPPYRISFGFRRAAISSLLSCGQKRGHTSQRTAQQGQAGWDFRVHPQSQQGPCSRCTPPHQAQHWVHSVASPLLLAHPSPLPLPGRSLVLLVRPGTQTAPSAPAHGCTSAALQENGAAPFLPLRYLLFALFLATAAAADNQHDKDHSSHHRHRNDQGFKVHCRMQGETLSTQIPGCWEVAALTATQVLLLESRQARRYF